jgi:ubiquitin carboxyl-terminal hydrolase L3
MAEETTEQKMRKVNWVPLESNPEMLNQFAHGVGLPSEFNFVDVYGVDEGLLMMVPRPCLAVTLLFDCSSEPIRSYKAEQDKHIKEAGQTISKDIFYMDQFVGNACGTIATMHAIGNNLAFLNLPEDCPLNSFFTSVTGMEPDKIGLALADASDIHGQSEASASGGQTAAPEATAKTDCHFICFVAAEGEVYELDGNKSFPINHGAIPEGGDLLSAAAATIKTKFMDTDPTSMSFNMMALVQGEGM